MLRRILVVPAAVLLLGLSLGLSACGGGDDDGRPTVVASFYPLEFLVEQIAGDGVRVVDLTAPGVEPHDLELQVKQVAEVSDADLVVFSAGLQPAVDRAVEENAGERALDVAPALDLDDDNPHFWLDPERMRTAAAEVEERLSEAVPDQAATFAANLADLDRQLAELDTAYRAGLADCRRDLVVTSHDAFGYLSEYGLRFASIAGLSPDAEPSPKRLAELHDLIRSDGITTVFGETLASTKLADTLADDLGVDAAVLDPIEGIAEGSDDDYLSLMRANLTALERANECTPEGTVP